MGDLRAGAAGAEEVDDVPEGVGELGLDADLVYDL